MKTRASRFLSLVLAVALMFTSVDLSVLAAEAPVQTDEIIEFAEEECTPDADSAKDDEQNVEASDSVEDDKQNVEASDSVEDDEQNVEASDTEPSDNEKNELSEDAAEEAEDALDKLENDNAEEFEVLGAAVGTEIDGIYYDLKGDVSPLVADVNGISALNTNETITIPETVTHEGKIYNTRYINTGAFRGNKTLKKIIIPENITQIGNYAFYGCENLTDVEGAAGLTKIDHDAFNGCKALKNFTMSGKMQSVGYNAFYNCTSLTKMYIPRNLTTIDGSAWNGCSGIVEVTFDSDIINIPENACRGMTGLKAVEIPNDVKKIGIDAFRDCTSLEKIDIPDSTTTLDKEAFYGCTGLKTVVLGTATKLATINDYAFYNCKALTGFAMPATMRTVGYRAFCNCIALTAMYIPKSLTSINASTWEGCSGIEKVTFDPTMTTVPNNACNGMTGLKDAEIPNGVKEIGAYAFSGCTSLEEITLPDTTTTLKEYVFNGCVSLKKVTSSKLTTIGGNTFGGCIALTTFILPNTLQKVEYRAFYNCSALTKMNIPKSLTEIEGSTWEGCSGITTVTFAEDALSIPDNACRQMTGLTEVYIPSKATTIGERAFNACSSLSKVTGCETVKTIGSYAFYGCKQLSDFDLPKNLTTINYQAFYECESLMSITIPKSLTQVASDVWGTKTGIETVKIEDGLIEIPASTFYRLNKVSEVDIPDSVTVIGSYAFRECSYLERITGAKNVIEIKDSAFYDCKNLRDFDLPAKLKILGQYSLAGCVALTKLTVPASLTDVTNPFGTNNTLSEITFEDGIKAIPTYMCEKLTGITSVTIPSSVTSIEKNAFYGCSNLNEVKGMENVKDIKDYAFYECKSLSKFDLPSKLETIGNNTFKTCESLEAITLPKTLITVGNDTWYGCKNIKKVTIEEGIKTIPDYMCEFLTGIEAVDIPASATSIGESAFRGCTSLASVTGMEGVKTIKGGAFADCGFTGFSIPAGVTEVKGTYVVSGSKLQWVFFPASVTSITGNPVNRFDSKLEVRCVAGSYAEEFFTRNKYPNVVPKNYVTGIAVKDGGKAVTELYLNKNSSKKLTATVTPSTAENKSIKWKSSDNSIFTVEQDGTITTYNKAGKAYLYVSAEDESGTQAIVAISIRKVSSADKLLAKTEAGTDLAYDSTGKLTAGKTLKLKIYSTLQSKYLDAEDFDFASSNGAYASVDDEGTITAAYTGKGTKTVTIKATLKEDRSMVATFNVNVINIQVAKVSLTPTAEWLPSGAYDAEKKTLYLDCTDVVAQCDSTVKAATIKISPKLFDSSNEVIETTNLTWATSDATIAKVTAIANDPDKAVTLTIPKTASGIVSITATAADEAKQSATLTIYVRDYTPIIPVKTVTLNSLATDNTGSIQAYAAYGNTLITSSENAANVVEIVDKNGTAISEISAKVAEDGKIVFATTKEFAKNVTLSNLTIKIPTEKGKISVSGVSVAVKNSAPAITVTQKGKFNLFLKDSTLPILVTAKNANVTAVEVESDFFEGTFAYGYLTLKYKEGLSEDTLKACNPNRKIKLIIKIDSYSPEYAGVVKTFTRDITIATEIKKPVLVQSRAKTELYYLYDNVSDLGGYYVSVKGSNVHETVELPAEAASYLALSNVTEYGITTATFTPQIEKVVKNNKNFYYFKGTNVATKKLKLSVTNENWVDKIDVDHTFSISTAVPVVKLSAAKITVNGKLYTEGLITFAPNPANIDGDLTYTVKSLDTKATTKAEAEKLNIVVNKDTKTIEVSIKDNETVKAGTYKFALATTVSGDKLNGISIKDVPFSVVVNEAIPTLSISSTTAKLNLLAKGVEATATVSVNHPEYEVVYSFENDPTNKLSSTDLDFKVDPVTGRITAKLGTVTTATANKTYKYKVYARVKYAGRTYADAAAVELKPVTYSITVIGGKQAEPSLVTKASTTLDVGKNRPQSYVVTGFKNVNASIEEVVAMNYVLEEYTYEKDLASGKMIYKPITEASEQHFNLSQEPIYNKNNGLAGKQLSIVPKNPSNISTKTFYYVRIRAGADFKGIAAENLSTTYFKFKPIQTAFTYTVSGDTTIYRSSTEQTGTVYMTVKNVPEFTPINGFAMISGSNTVIAMDKNNNPIFDQALGEAICISSVKYEGNKMIVKYYVADSSKLTAGKTYSFTLAVMPTDATLDAKPVNVKLSFTVKK